MVQEEVYTQSVTKNNKRQLKGQDIMDGKKMLKAGAAFQKFALSDEMMENPAKTLAIGFGDDEESDDEGEYEESEGGKSKQSMGSKLLKLTKKSQ